MQAERKKAAMRKAARARILGKRAAAAAKHARAGAGGGKGGVTRGGKARVFRRAKRDCRVMDARRKKLGAYLFCGKAACVVFPGAADAASYGACDPLLSVLLSVVCQDL